jgi:DDE family transposase
MAEMLDASLTSPGLDQLWPAVLARISGVLDLEYSARTSRALQRRREVRDGATLLRLALAHGPGGLSLRSAASWAGVTGIAQLSDVALRKRLRGCSEWLGEIAGALLNQPAPEGPLAGSRLRIVDGSSFSDPHAVGTSWRLHAAYDPAAARFTDLELTGEDGGEGFQRFAFQSGDIAIGDRGYARPRGLQHVLAAGADFVVRVGWTSLRLVTPAGKRIDWEAIYSRLSPGEITECDVVVARTSKGAKRRTRPLFPARLIVMRQHQEPADRAIRAVHRRHSKTRHDSILQPMTLASARYLMILTSIPSDRASAMEVLAAYRLRWQIELAFKRLKSGLGMDRVLARDPAMARSWLLAHLILALLIEDAASEILDSPPCVPHMPVPSGVAVAFTCRTEGRAARRNPEPNRDPGTTSSRPCTDPPYLRSAAKADLPVGISPH